MNATYFSDKRGALLALTQETARSLYGSAVAPLLGSTPGSPRETIRARTAAFFRTYAEEWDVVRTWIQASGIHREVEELRSRIRTSIAESMDELLRRDQKSGLIPPEIDLDIAMVAMIAMSEEFANRWLSEGRELGDREVDQLTDLWVRAVYRSDAPT